MGLRAKRVALQAQVTGTSTPGTGPAEGTGSQEENPSPLAQAAVSTSAVPEASSNAGAKDSRTIAREKLDKVVTGGDQSIKADHPNNKLRSNSFDDSVRLFLLIFRAGNCLCNGDRPNLDEKASVACVGRRSI